MITRLIVALAFTGMLLSAGAGRASAQTDYAGNINSCSDLGAGYVDASALVTVTANDGTYLSYTATAAVVGVIKGGDNYRVYPAMTAGVALHAPLNGGGNVPAISHYLFCSVPGGEEPPVEDCTTDPALPECEEEPTCETDPTLCEEPVDEEPTCETDPTLCEEPTGEEPTNEEVVTTLPDAGAGPLQGSGILTSLIATLLALTSLATGLRLRTQPNR